MAPRDLAPGEHFAAAVSEAIEGSRVVVLVLSTRSNASAQVCREVARASEARIPILCLRVEDVQPSKDLSYFLGITRSVDALTPHLENHLEELAAVIAKLPRREQEPPARESVAATGPRPTADSPSALTAPAPTAPAHLIFISAKSEDYDAATQVYQFLTDRGLRAFFSKESLPELGNADYGDQIDEALEETAHMVVVTSSRENVTSEWVKAEWRLFVNEKRGGRKAGNLLTVTTGEMGIVDLPATLRGYEVVPLTSEGLDRLLKFVKDPPRSAFAAAGEPPEQARVAPATPATVTASTESPLAAGSQASGDERCAPAASATETAHAETVPPTSGHLIFISANGDDQEYASQVYEFLVGHGLRVFFARESLPERGGADFSRRIDDAIDEAAHMVVVTSSRERVMSRWVQSEWQLFSSLLRSGRKQGNLLTVAAGQMPTGDLPVTLLRFQVVSLTEEGLDSVLRLVGVPLTSV